MAQLQKVAETFSPDDVRFRALGTVVSHRLAAAPPMRVSIAAAFLGLSEPTARAWANRGVLRVRSRKPRLLLDSGSVLEVRQLIDELRRAGISGNLLDEVFNRLSDEQTFADPELAESLEQMHRGEYVVRRSRSSWSMNVEVRATPLANKIIDGLPRRSRRAYDAFEPTSLGKVARLWGTALPVTS